MKKILLVLFSVILLVSCGEHKERDSEIGKQLKGEHELKILNSVHDTIIPESKYFSIKSSKLYFCWKTNDNTYSIDYIDITKIKIAINEEIEVPTIKFRWIPSSENSLQQIMDLSVIYAVITCKEQDSKFILRNATK